MQHLIDNTIRLFERLSLSLGHFLESFATKTPRYMQSSLSCMGSCRLISHYNSKPGGLRRLDTIKHKIAHRAQNSEQLGVRATTRAQE
jgi:hypothetical protein